MYRGTAWQARAGKSDGEYGRQRGVWTDERGMGAAAKGTRRTRQSRDRVGARSVTRPARPKLPCARLDHVATSFLYPTFLSEFFFSTIQYARQLRYG